MIFTTALKLNEGKTTQLIQCEIFTIAILALHHFVIGMCLMERKGRISLFFELTLPNVYFSHPGIYLRWVALEGAVAFLRGLCSTLRLRRWRLLRTWLLRGRIWAEMSACRGFRCRSGGVSWVRTLWWLRTGTRSGQVLG